MDLRVKCKCGKTLSIPESLAGRKVGCPGCKKIYRIPAERFQAAGAKQPPRPQPVAAAATASSEFDALISPSQIDITPSELDLLGDLGQSSGDFLSNAPAAPPAATKPCPNCKAPMAETAVLCTACGFNTAKGKLTRSAALKKTSKPTKGKAKRKLLPLVLVLILVAAGGGAAWFFALR